MGEKSARNDVDVKSLSARLHLPLSEAEQETAYFDAWNQQKAGHVEDDMWEVDRIIEEDASGGKFLVRWLARAVPGVWPD